MSITPSRLPFACFYYHVHIEINFKFPIGQSCRLVGLLMVTRVLPASDIAAIRQVYETAGPRFFTQLLLPLRASSSSTSASLTEEKAQQQVGMSALGLAVLSSAAQVPEIATGEDFLQLVPLFLATIKAGGVSPLVFNHLDKGSAQRELDLATDSVAVRDALECAVAAATSGPEGRQIVEESSGLNAASAALRTAARSDPSTDDIEIETWAVRLAAAVLVGSERAEVIERNSDAVQSLIPALGRVIALPALLKDEQKRREAAVVHLEALHSALLLLPLPIPEAIVVQENLSRGSLQAVWPRYMRLGIATVLRGRGSVVQRHGALQLSSAMVGIAGPQWLTYPLGRIQGVDNPEEGGKFFQLIVEILKVEINVLLHDALAPRAKVPLSSAPGTAAAHWLAPEPKPMEEIEEEELEGDFVDELAMKKPTASPETGSADVSGLTAVLGSDTQREAMAARMTERNTGGESGGSISGISRVLEEIKLKDSDVWKGPTESAGERALRMLPCCFLLLEASIEALAEDAEDEEAAGGGISSGLGSGVAQRALASIQETVELLLQVLEDGSEGDTSPKLGSSVSEPLKVAAVCALGRFLAECPDAFSDRVRAALPKLLAVHSTPVGASPTYTERSSFSEDSMLNSFGEFVERVRSDEGSLAPDTLAEGVTFMLPLLLQVTDPARHAQHAKDWYRWQEDIIRGDSLHRLVDYAVIVAESRARTVTAAAAVAVDSTLLAVCRVLLNVATNGQHEDGGSRGIISPFQKSNEERLSFAVADAIWPLVTALVEVLSSPGLEDMAESSEEEARMVGCCTALLAAVLCAVAEEADHPDDAHRAKHDLFRRRSGFGMGPLSGDDVQLACDSVLNSMRSIHTMLSKVAQHGKHTALHHEESIKEVQGDYQGLLHSVEELMAICPAFNLAIQGSEWITQVASNENISPLAPDFDRQILKALHIS